MKISTWDEISMEWAEHELDIDSTTDPIAINRALGKMMVGDGLQDDDCNTPDGWVVKSHSMIGPILTIETRGDRNHLAITIVNYEDQESDDQESDD